MHSDRQHSPSRHGPPAQQTHPLEVAWEWWTIIGKPTSYKCGQYYLLVHFNERETCYMMKPIKGFGASLFNYWAILYPMYCTFGRPNILTGAACLILLGDIGYYVWTAKLTYLYHYQTLPALHPAILGEGVLLQSKTADYGLKDDMLSLSRSCIWDHLS